MNLLNKFKKSIFASLLLGVTCIMANSAAAQSSEKSKSDANDIATKLTNPVADLISFPIQYNYDANIGIDKKGTANSLIVQPVVPIKLNNDWNYILRPVITLESLSNVNGYTGSGAAPITLETFFSPRAASDVIWGVGPIVTTPSLSGRNFGTAQTGVGVTAVGLVMKAPWTIGLLTYNTWGTGGDTTSGTANNLYYQPFISYVTHDAWTYSLNTQSTYNWDTKQSENPMNATISKLVKFGELPVSFTVGARYYLNSMPGGPSGWGARASMTFVFPK